MDEVHHTLYINNLNDKVKKDEMKTQLYALFSQYGQIVDVFVSKDKRLRGQAWLAYRDVASAATALRALQSFPFYEKQIRIQFAKRDSERLSSARDKEKKRRTADADKHTAGASKKQKATTEDQASAAATNRSESESDSAQKRATEAGSNANRRGSDADAQNTSAEKIQEEETNADDLGADNEPNKILFVRGLAAGSTTEHVAALFGQFAGYREARVPPGRSDFAFVEFDTPVNAQAARDALDRFRVTPTCVLHIQFARK